MENNILTSNQIMEQLSLNISSLCEMFDEGDSGLDVITFKQLTNGIKSSIDSLTKLKSTLEINQYDFDCCGDNSFDVEICYDFNYSKVSGDNVIYNYSHCTDSGSVQINKDYIIEHLDNGGDINELITEEIERRIYNQLS
jgi:hypothetical protein